MNSLFHAASSFIGVVITSLILNVSLHTLLLWSIIGIVVSVAIDFDHLLIAAVKGKKKVVLDAISNPLYSAKNISKFRRKIYFRGFGIIRLFTHGIEIIVLLIILSIYYPNLIIPVLVSLVIHWSSDLIETIVYPQRR
jgi:hypothetical protein